MQTARSVLMDVQELTVLLIEDSTGDAVAIMKALCYGDPMYNFKVQRKPSLSEGLDFLGKNSVDAVLLDLGLPDARALAALHKVHEKFPDVPIVIVSGYSDMERVHAALHSGAQEFLIKGECSGVIIRQSIYQAISRKKIELSYQRGDRL